MILRRPPGSDPHAPELRQRTGALLAVVAMAMALLVGRLWQLQVIRGDDYYAKARSNVVKTQRPPAVRGRMFDRGGRVLADSRPSFDIAVDPSELDPAGLEGFIAELDLDSSEADEVRRRVEGARQRGVRELVTVLERQGHERAAAVRQIRYRVPGVAVIDGSTRVYPNDGVAAHLLGYLNQPTGMELRRLPSDIYQLGDVIGRFGLERRYEAYLHGKRGVERYLVNASGERVEGDAGELAELIGSDPYTAPDPGHDLHLSIDLELQRAAEQALAGKAAGAVAVIEVATGRVLALVSQPAFDPNAMSGALTLAQETELYGDPRRPFIDKTLRQHYPPGSTFKLITAIAAVESGKLSPSERFSCGGAHEQGGRVFHCTSSHGSVDLTTAIQRSCNVYFWKVAERIGLDRIAETARAFGFGEVTGLDLNDEVPGRIPDTAYYKERGGYTIGYSLNAAVGQGDVEVTVLQLALAYAAIANGGTLYLPQIVDRIDSVAGTSIARYQPIVRNRVELGERTRAALASGTFRAVNEPGGTAFRHAGPGRDGAVTGEVAMAGKTGTAQVRARQAKAPAYEGWHPHQHHAWFAGYAPAGEPEIAIAVLVEHGGSGGREAGPIARVVADAYFAAPKEASP
jgi:penicillin-binding protein 2